jgi:hypothetical protein
MKMEVPKRDPRVTTYDVFTFETLVRELVHNAITPVQKDAERNYQRLVSTHLTV